MNNTKNPMRQTIYPVKKIIPGTEHIIYLCVDGSVFGCGSNEYGQLGIGWHDKEPHTMERMDLRPLQGRKVIDVAVGYMHTLLQCIDRNGKISIWVCGNNQYGQLGNGSRGETAYTATLVPMDLRPLHGSRVVGIYAVSFHTMLRCIDKKGNVTVWGCGCNKDGQLGNGRSGDKEFEATLVQMNLHPLQGQKVLEVTAGDKYTILRCVDKNNKTVWGCGDNEHGQLGNGQSGYGAEETTLVPMNLLPLHGQKVLKVTAGCVHTILCCADNKNNKTVWGCGYNDYGQLGKEPSSDDDNHEATLVQIGKKQKVLEVMAGSMHTILLCGNENNITVLGCGSAGDGELGNNQSGRKAYEPTLIKINVQPLQGRKVIGLAAEGGPYTILRCADGSVWGCGLNNNGQLAGLSQEYEVVMVLQRLPQIKYIDTTKQDSLVKSDLTARQEYILEGMEESEHTAKLTNIYGKNDITCYRSFLT